MPGVESPSRLLLNFGRISRTQPGIAILDGAPGGGEGSPNVGGAPAPVLLWLSALPSPEVFRLILHKPGNTDLREPWGFRRQGEGVRGTFTPPTWGLRFQEGLIPLSLHPSPLSSSTPGFGLNFLRLERGDDLEPPPFLPAASPLVSALMIPTAIGEGVAVAPTCTSSGAGPGPEFLSWVCPLPSILLPTPNSLP